MPYIRKTEDVFEIQALYGNAWETVCAETSRKEARETKRCYLDNEGGAFRIVKKRKKNYP